MIKCAGLFRRDKIRPRNQVDVTGLHSQDAFVRALRSAGYHVVKENGRTILAKSL